MPESGSPASSSWNLSRPRQQASDESVPIRFAKPADEPGLEVGRHDFGQLRLYAGGDRQSHGPGRDGQWHEPELQYELDAPTIARAVPMKINAGLASRPANQEKLGLHQLNIPAPCPPRSAACRAVADSRRLIPVNQERGLASLFQPSTSSSLSVRDATIPTMPR